jgi:hypothetical protein
MDNLSEELITEILLELSTADLMLLRCVSKVVAKLVTPAYIMWTPITFDLYPREYQPSGFVKITPNKFTCSGKLCIRYFD